MHVGDSLIGEKWEGTSGGERRSWGFHGEGGVRLWCTTILNCYG